MISLSVKILTRDFIAIEFEFNEISQKKVFPFSLKKLRFNAFFSIK